MDTNKILSSTYQRYLLIALPAILVAGPIGFLVFFIWSCLYPESFFKDSEQEEK